VLNRKSPRVDAKRAALKACAGPLCPTGRRRLPQRRLDQKAGITALRKDFGRPESRYIGDADAAHHRRSGSDDKRRLRGTLGRRRQRLGNNEHCQCFAVNARRDACPDQTERLVQMASAASDFRSFHFSRVPVREGDFPTEVMRPFRQLGFARRIVSLSPTHYFICNAIEHF